jgi:uncharacterized ferritin-like protein (DUF455 family)
MSFARHDLRPTFVLTAPSVFELSSVDQKLAKLESEVSAALNGNLTGIPKSPRRDVPVVQLKDLAPKMGLGSPAGLARLLHDLANIELQAMELALRSLYEFPNAPKEFREQLADLTLSEGRHLQLCLTGLRNLGFEWGDWPVHLSLWNCVRPQDTLLDRLLIVHRYLEGSGLDAGDALLKRLAGANAPAVRDVVRVIVEEEVGHVLFGSIWYQRLCALEGLDADHDFKSRFEMLKATLPRRQEMVVPEIRRRAGFSENEIRLLQKWRQEMLTSKPVEELTIKQKGT